MLATFRQWLSPETVHTKADWVLFWLAWLLHLPLPLFLVLSIQDGNWRNIIGSVLAILISFVPRWMEARSRYRFPALGEFCISLAMTVELFGRVFHLYEGSSFPYDAFSHAIIIGTLTTFAILLLYAFFYEQDVDYDGWFILMVGLIIGLGLGGLWEIYEWTADSLANTDFQHGLSDTMKDLTMGALGALVGTFATRAYVQRHEPDEVMEELPIFYEWL